MIKEKVHLPLESDIKKVLKFDSKKLPSFPQAAAKLLEMTKDEETSLSDLAKLVETDPGISATVLKLANSAYYGLKSRITTISDAVVYLGFDEIKKLAMGMAVFKTLFSSGKTRAFDRLFFWRHCLSVAVLSMEIARETGYPNPEEAYVGGLLHDIGKIFFDTQGRADYGEFIASLSDTSVPIIEEERKIMGMGHDNVGAFYCSLWELPERLLLAAKYHHQRFAHLDFSGEEQQLIAIVSLADFFCWTQGIGSFDMVRPPVLTPEVEAAVDLDTIDIIKIINNMNREMENISEFYQFVFPTSSELHENLLWANLKLGDVNTKYYYYGDNPPETADTEYGEAPPASPDITLELGKPLAKARTVKETLDIVMYQIGDIFKPMHWSLLLKDQKTGDMNFTLVVGPNKEKLQGKRLKKGEGIAGHIMETGEPTIVEDVAKDDRFSIRVDKFTGFKTHSIVGVPLKTGDKIFGVIELVNKISGDNFTETELGILSSIGEYAAIAIERSYYNQSLTKIAMVDSLTGLKNRWSFEHTFSNRSAMESRYGPRISMLMISIKEFRRVTDEKGYKQGEKILVKLGAVLKKTLRKVDDVFRYEGDIFIALLPDTDRESADLAVQRIVHNLDAEAFREDEIPFSLSVSVRTVKTEDASELLAFVKENLSQKRADKEKAPLEQMENNLQSVLEKEREAEAESLKTHTKKTFRKKFQLAGEYRHVRSREFGPFSVEHLSLQGIRFTVRKAYHSIKENDFLDINFTLDNKKQSEIKRRLLVKTVKDKLIEGDFYNPPPFDSDLGFYLMR